MRERVRKKWKASCLYNKITQVIGDDVVGRGRGKGIFRWGIGRSIGVTRTRVASFWVKAETVRRAEFAGEVIVIFLLKHLKVPYVGGCRKKEKKKRKKEKKKKGSLSYFTVNHLSPHRVILKFLPNTIPYHTI